MKIKVKNGTIKATRNISLLAGGLFTLTGASLVIGATINNIGINWQDILTISSTTATTGTLLTAGYAYRYKILKELKHK